MEKPELFDDFIEKKNDIHDQNKHVLYDVLTNTITVRDDLVITDKFILDYLESHSALKQNLGKIVDFITTFGVEPKDISFHWFDVTQSIYVNVSVAKPSEAFKIQDEYYKYVDEEVIDLPIIFNFNKAV
ncbi:MAG TPA: hypothetical protein PKD96_01705 [Candidatus Absconditabacterales bacterium]|nr:hypothetical protein [Candidatus Absconditabacterales bacterium]HMT26993.1 hypothetical protein [Candidatus Absconditabacterales bacterium]